MAVIRDQGKTTFAREVLTKNNQANVKAVNDAWKEAGHEGSISDTLVNKVRSDMRLVGNIRRGRQPAGSNGAPASTVTTSKKKVSVVVKKPVGRPPGKANGRHEPTATAPAIKARAASADRLRVLQEMEAEIDNLIFKSLGAGGFPEFEETLRKARRILARSHQD